MVRLHWEGHEIELRDEPMYLPGSADNHRPYGHEVSLAAAGKHPGSRCGVTLSTGVREVASCVVLASGGGLPVHGRSAVVIGDRLFLAIANRICALRLPSLELDWDRETDVVACFGVVAVTEEEGLISHGELEIMRLALDGSVMWRQGGRDIFTGSLTVDAMGDQVTDWNGDLYCFNLSTGESSRREP